MHAIQSATVTTTKVVSATITIQINRNEENFPICISHTFYLNTDTGNMYTEIFIFFTYLYDEPVVYKKNQNTCDSF